MLSGKRLPPGRLGLPIIKDLSYKKNPFQFIEDGIADHGPVFKSRLLFHKAVVMAGPQAIERFINPSLIQRAGAFPGFVERLFGGKSLPFLDGDVHLARKEIVLGAFTESALSSYIPSMQRMVEASFQRWSTLREFVLIDGLKRLAFEVICSNILGLDPSPQLNQLQHDYEVVSSGLVSFPGRTYWQALKARARILTTLRGVVTQRNNSPTDDGVSRILSSTSRDGTRLTVDEATLETHHAIIAGFIIFAEMASAILFSNAPSTVRQQLVAEVKSIPKGGALSMADLAKLRYVGKFVMEVKRLCPIIPAVFGKAKKDFEIHGVTVPAGWLVLWAVRSTNVFDDSFVNRMQFNPDRFDILPQTPFRFIPQGGGPFTFVPQGGGPPKGHRCAGLDYSTLLLEIFTIVLIRDYAVRLKNPVKNPDAVYNWKLNPPQPWDGLPATVTPN